MHHSRSRSRKAHSRKAHSRKAHSRKAHSRKTYHSRKAYRSRKAHSRNNCRSTRRRIGGAHMTVIQPYKYDSQNDYPSEFEIEINPNIEEMYNQILNHRYNAYSDKMAPTFADQGEYIVKFYDDIAMITRKVEDNMSFEDRLAALR
jgi:hypothetical protein